MRAKDADQLTKIDWTRYDDRALVFSDERSIARRLLRHPLFEPEQVLKSDGDPVAVEGLFPVRALQFRCFKRQATAHAEVVPYDAEEKRRYAQEVYDREVVG